MENLIITLKCLKIWDIEPSFPRKRKKLPVYESFENSLGEILVGVRFSRKNIWILEVIWEIFRHTSVSTMHFWPHDVGKAKMGLRGLHLLWKL